MCGMMTYNVWTSWKGNPIIVDTEAKKKPIIEIPFPGVTICAFTQFASSKFNYTAAQRLLLKLDGNNTRNLTAAEYVDFNRIDQ